MDVRQLDLSVVAENVFVWSFGPKCSVSPPSDCTLEILLLTYLHPRAQPPGLSILGSLAPPKIGEQETLLGVYMHD